MFKYSSVPAYSMGPKGKGLPDQGFPGPGNYDETDAIGKTSPHPNDPKWKFPKDPREAKYGNANPGPGHYESPGKGKYEGGYMGHKGADDSGLNVPGPGTYTDDSVRFKQAKAPAYSMRAKGAPTPKDNIPGPGQYDADANRLEWKSYSGKIVSKAARDNTYKNQNPGPGNYDPNNSTFAKAQGKFPKADRDGFRPSGVPNVGPGSYDVGSSFVKKGYSYGKQPRDGAFGSANPGPGTYDYNASTFSGPRYKFGQTSRDGAKNAGNPGPGNYDADKNMFSKQSGKINPEAKESSNYNYPGPGTYDGDYHVQKDTKPKFSFGKETKPNRDLGVPGPGTYDANGIKTKASIAVGKEDKGMKYGNAFPGPGTYDGDNELRYSWDPKYSFGKDRRDKDMERLKVGPGDYDIPHSIPDVATYNYPSKNNRKIHL